MADTDKILEAVMDLKEGLGELKGRQDAILDELKKGSALMGDQGKDIVDLQRAQSRTTGMAIAVSGAISLIGAFALRKFGG